MLAKPRIVPTGEIHARLLQSRQRAGGSYLAMYSTWLGGIVVDPEWMLLPLDEHMVHRGDGIFEAARIVSGAIYDLKAHLLRLEKSAEKIGLKLPASVTEMAEVCVATAEAARSPDAALRLFVGRGAGSFSPNPFDPAQSELYIVVTSFKPVPETSYEAGVSMLVATTPAKESPYSQIKSCNYLQNVLMKKEAVERGVDFTVSIDREGRVCEGATENLFVLSDSGTLMVPKFDYTLRGTTMLVILEALEKNQVHGVTDVVLTDITVDDLNHAREIAMVGTTLEVLPVSKFAGQPVGTGRSGPVARELRQLLRQDMQKNSNRRTPVPLRGG